MSATLIDYAAPPTSATQAELDGRLLQLMGLPYLFSRMSYGDELTLHFGAPRDAAHPKLRAKGIAYGTHVLSVRGSAWILDSGTLPVIVADQAVVLGPSAGRQVTAEELGSQHLITPGARVWEVATLGLPHGLGYGLSVQLSDGTHIVVIPTLDGSEGQASETASDDRMRALADWELRTPNVTLRVGPGPDWDVEQRAAGE